MDRREGVDADRRRKLLIEHEKEASCGRAYLQMLAQFNHVRQLAPVLAGLPNRKGGRFIDGEHGGSSDLPSWREQALDE